MNYSKRFKVSPGEKIKLKDVDSSFKDEYKNHQDAAEETERYRTRLRELQELLFVGRQHALLLCLQAMDTGGKDGTINHVLGAMNPQGCRVAPFKQPSAEEASHDFLWRAHRAAPARGEVVIFNRSHYEDVLVVRVHELAPRDVWSLRYDRINAFEEGLVEEGAHILKFYLHISKEEQFKRLKARLDDPTKHWKVNEGDFAERERWDDYMAAYEDVLSRCSTEDAPWFVIPADHKWFRNLAIARIVVDYLEGLDLSYPKPAADIERIRRQYFAAK